ncbi:cytochrome b/b6 domain-containing protein [Acidisphaera rubrifaciens]|uniref:Cytochrome b561 bacterial/Ni-hydrogenase domain-containing protein n=1 Tax=Acidisphaera rubrifaciens HS-AP3 TaxID=1231350 RepID=A0A0D6PAK9_9PROT|nr:cytochrome b/b6 domain-containing protein [Acidisphaera rubrifaciens]GAN78228.1 hypothetical protein Asru_0691_02 [Acidisphaera rubrifaciens HS-AP3]
MSDIITPSGRVLARRHGVVVRVTHWINLICMFLLLASGLQIFNAHPALYWGSASDFDHPAFSPGPFPPWMTLPSWQSLAEGRQWHFAMAWLFVINATVYAAWSLASGHLRRDLVPTGADLRHLPASVAEHARLRFPEGEAARRYNVLQRLAYLVVMFGLVPLIIVAGCAMSPRLDAGYHWLPALFGGRQSARTVHFIAAWSLVAFVVLHVVMVILSGPLNNLRGMITGRYAIGRAR